MGIKGRQAAVFACGIALGAVAAAWLVMERSAPGAGPVRGAVAQPVAPATAVATADLEEGTRCEFEPVIKPVDDEDGSRRLPADLGSRTAADVRPMIVTGKENAAAGRLRDAEVAFLGACRIGRELRDAGAAGYADAKYQLGRHYALVARSGETSAAELAELTQRARLLYADALAALRAQHGDQHEKTRFAMQGLASLEQSVVGGPPAASEEPPGAATGSAAAAR